MKRIAVLLIALTIVMAGCGGPKDDTLGANGKDESQKGSPDMANN